MHHIVLTGFMGAGKSAVGTRLAWDIGWKFADLDGEIVRAAGKSVGEIFQESGEARFREMERDALKKVLQQQSIVIALGGGAIESAENRQLLGGRRTLLVYLEAPLELLLRRCVDQYGANKNAPRRPVLENEPELNQRFLRRRPLYESAHVTISTADCGVEEVVRRIVKEWKRRAIADHAR